MQHYVLIRFNYEYLKKVNNPKRWLEERIEMYNTWCYPSLEKQTCKDFEILVLCDKETPEKYLKKISGKLLFGTGSVSSLFAEYINKRNYNDWVITTRLDNDDLLKPDSIRKIQAKFCNKEMIIGGKNEILIIGDGYYRDTTKSKQTPFLSLIEPPGNKKTVYYRPHTKMHKLYNCEAVNGYIGTHVHHGNNKGQYTSRHLGEKLPY